MSKAEMMHKKRRFYNSCKKCKSELSCMNCSRQMYYNFLLFKVFNFPEFCFECEVGAPNGRYCNISTTGNIEWTFIRCIWGKIQFNFYASQTKSIIVQRNPVVCRHIGNCKNNLFGYQTSTSQNDETDGGR